MKTSIKNDRRLLLTSILLFFMLAAGIISGVLWFILGHEALRGVTQPDIRPNNTKGGNAQNLQTKGLELLKEKDLIASVKKQIGAEDPKRDAQLAKDAKKQAQEFEKEVRNDPKSGIPAVALPIVREDQGIEISIKSIDAKSTNVKYVVTLVNRGSQAVNFGRSTVTAVNDKSQPVNVSTKGMPSSLPANGKEAKLIVSIPKNALDKIKTVSLQLTDTDKKLQLEVSGLPVK
jgi:hypothetical protein